MRRRGLAFALIFIFALGVFVSGGIYLWAAARAYTLTGEVYLGERGDASGLGFTQETVLSRHLDWQTDYDAGSGGAETGASWSLARREIGEEAAPPSLTLEGVGFEYSERWYGLDRHTAGLPFAQGILDGIYDMLGGAPGQRRVKLSIGGYMDSVPLRFACQGLSISAPSGGDYAYGRVPLDVFGLPIGEKAYFDAYLSLNSTASTFKLWASSGETYDVSSDCVFAADGCLYLVLDVRTKATHSSPAALADGSALPGGGWGVYRIPCSFADGAPDGERWWVSGGYEVVPDFSAVENIYPLGDSWGGAALGLSYDGTQLLLFTAGEDLTLTVIDLASGDTVQQMELLSDPEDYIRDMWLDWDSFSAFDGGYALTSGSSVLYALEQDGLYGRAQTISLAQAPMPGQRDGSCSINTLDFEARGGNLAILESGLYMSERSENYLRLTLYSAEGECIYAEWITPPLAGMYGSHRQQTDYDFKRTETEAVS